MSSGWIKRLIAVTSAVLAIEAGVRHLTTSHDTDLLNARSLLIRLCRVRPGRLDTQETREVRQGKR